MNQGLKGIGLNPNTYIHLTDHLAPLCVMMNMPLLLTHAGHAEVAKELYPELQILLIDWVDFTPYFLIEHFDVFFQSEPWPRQNFYQSFQKLEEKMGKTVRNVHCPHGFSDKVFWLEKGVWEDILLVYGQNMLDLFGSQDLLDHLNIAVRTGNYRYSYYRKHQIFYDQLFQKRFGKRLDSKKQTILYAPTCHDQEHSTSLFHTEDLFKNLPSDYHLMVKIHPALEETDGALLEEFIKKYEHHPNILFIKDFPLVYPLLAHADIYVGDMSSIGYDFLLFNKPMFFLNQLKRNVQTNRELFLYRCGVEIRPEHYKNFYQILEEELPRDQLKFGAKRQEVYQYTFGDPLSFAELKHSIEASYFLPKKWN